MFDLVFNYYMYTLRLMIDRTVYGGGLCLSESW